MKKHFRKILGAALACTAMFTGAIGLTANAYVNSYSVINPYYSSDGNVYFGVTVTNRSGYVSSFNYYGALYNNTNNTMYGATNSMGNALAIGNNVTTSVMGYKSYSTMPDHTRCENHVSCYYGSTIPTYGTPYETFVGNSYFDK